MKLEKLNKIGLRSLICALFIMVVLSMGIETGLINEEGLLIYILSVFASVGLIVFLAVGFYFWLYNFKKVGKFLRFWGWPIYFACTSFAGYWAFYKISKANEQPNI